MKAVTYQGIKDVKVKEVKDPTIEKADDIIVKITNTAICGSDLHLVHGMIPHLPEDYVIGHEPMGIVEETGPDVTRLKKGDRVIVPFTIACGHCYYCQHDLESQCDHSNPHGEVGAYFGYSRLLGAMLAGKRNIYVFHMGILHLLKYQKTRNWKMNRCSFYRISFQPLTGVSIMPG